MALLTISVAALPSMIIPSAVPKLTTVLAEKLSPALALASASAPLVNVKVKEPLSATGVAPPLMSRALAVVGAASATEAAVTLTVSVAVAVAPGCRRQCR